MKLLREVLLTGLAWCAMLPVQAQEAWTLGRVLSAAWSQHPIIQEKRANELAAKADWDGAKWQRFPSPSLEANTAKKGGNTLRIDQPLWTGGRITANLDLAEAQYELARASVEEATLELSDKSIAAVVEALRQADRKHHAQLGVREHEKLLEMIQRRVNQEVSSQSDQRLANSRLYASRNDLSLAVQAHANALAQIGQLVGQPVAAMDDRDIRLADQGISESLDEVIALVQSQSARLKRLAWEERVAEAAIDAKRSAWWPQLLYRFERVRADQRTDSRSMLVLQAQPGAGLSAKSGVDAALARRDSARHMRLLAERELREQAQQLWNDWQASKERYRNSQEAQSMSSDVAASYARQYAAGRKSWLDVLNAVREATQSEFAVVDAQAQSRLAALRLQALMGKVLNSSDASALAEGVSR